MTRNEVVGTMSRLLEALEVVTGLRGFDPNSGIAVKRACSVFVAKFVDELEASSQGRPRAAAAEPFGTVNTKPRTRKAAPRRKGR